ncbi:MAG: hypothetical protein KatS3mg111_3734 [Pirellulaceae bacterium]|nr:MAG: hypothetical protein KatS3mg111_3734 [Pirellulaceae bacterium]
MKRIPWVDCRLVLLGMVVACSWPACAQSPSPPLTRSWEGEEFSLQLFDNSDSYSCVTAINNQGHVIGIREAANEDGTILSQKSWYSDGKRTRDVPLLEGFTNIVAEAISDSGLVVGFASRKMGHPQGSLVGFVWDPQSETPMRLSPARGDTASHAFDITADGARVCGYTTGANPARLRPCVWDWNDQVQRWEVTVLEAVFDYNPYLMTGRAVISPNGSQVAACVTERFLGEGRIDSSLYVWKATDSGWRRTQLSPLQMRLHDINNAGVMVGDLAQPTARVPCRIDADGQVIELGFLPGDRSGEARGINASGWIVGFSDNPGNLDSGPRAFLLRGESIEQLPLPDESIFSAAYAINDRGQIGGLADVSLPDSQAVDPESGKPQEIVKTVGFVWTPRADGTKSR